MANIWMLVSSGAIVEDVWLNIETGERFHTSRFWWLP